MIPRPVNPGRRRVLIAASQAAAALALPIAARAQAWPTRPVRLVVGFAAGGLTDALPRLIAPHLSQLLGQPVIVENRPGVAGNIATTFVAKAAADGHTLLASGAGQIVVTPHTSRMEVDPMTDLAHITMLGEGDQILNIAADVPATDLAGFIAHVRRNPGRVFYGDAGAGGNQHLYLEYFRMLAGIDMQAVHYRGGALMLADLLANRVQLSLNAPSLVEAHIVSGRLRPVMIVGRRRHRRMPGVPTCAEVAGFEPLQACSNWFGLHAPKDTPMVIQRQLHAAVVTAMKQPAVQAGLAQLAVDAVIDAPQAFAARLARDHALFGDIARRANIRM